jgi:hypothetical protein
MPSIIEKSLIKLFDVAGSSIMRRKRDLVNPSDDDLLIGRANNLYHPNQHEDIYLTIPERLRHTYIIGASGSGKTRLLEFLVRQEILSGRGFALLDVHGDISNNLLKFIGGLLERNDGKFNARYVSQKLVLIEPFNRKWTVGFNPFVLRGVDPYIQLSEFMGVFKKLWADAYWGPRMEELLRSCSYTLIVHGMTLLEAKTLLTDSAFRDQLVSSLPEGEIKDYWLFRYNQLSEKMQATYREPLLNRISAFVTEPSIRAMIGQTKSIDFRNIMDQEKWLLVNLSKGHLKSSADLLGSLIVAAIQLAALSRVDIPEARRAPFTLFVDEFQNLATHDFQIILSECRKQHLALVLIHQNMDQLDRQLRSAILGNTLTQISSRLSNQDAATLSSEFSQKEKPMIQRMLIDLKTREAIIKRKGQRPRLMKTYFVPEPQANPKAAEKVRELSFSTYGRLRKEVEEEIATRARIISGRCEVHRTKTAQIDPHKGQFAPQGKFEEAHEW